MDKHLKDLRKQYEDVPIPKELDAVIDRALDQRPRKKRKPLNWLVGSAAAVAVFTTSVNVSPSLAKELSQIPVLNELVEVLTFKEYTMESATTEVDIKVPQVTGDSEDLQWLNEQYAADGQALYEEYRTFIDEYEGANFGLLSDYKVVTDTPELLVIQKSVETIAASSVVGMKYANIDRVNETVITLPSLFIDETYVERITSYVLEQMHQEMEQSNGETIYWVAGSEYVEDVSAIFRKINREQAFFINEDGKLMISFDEGEVAPYYLGVVEIEIPTEVIKDLLVSAKYIQ